MLPSLFKGKKYNKKFFLKIFTIFEFLILIEENLQ